MIVRSLSEPGEDRIRAMIEGGLLALTGERHLPQALSVLFSREDRIGVKISIMSPATHEAVAGGLGDLVARWGVDEGRIFFWDRTRCGFGPRGYADMHLAVGTENGISKAVTRHATALINLPRLKAHWLSGVSGALKNWAGAVEGINTADSETRFPIHENHCEKVGMLQALPEIRSRCRLILMDALRPLCFGGPHVRERYLWDCRALVLGVDPVAVDSVGLGLIQEGQKVLGCTNSRLAAESVHISAAKHRYGLGENDLSKIEVMELTA